MEAVPNHLAIEAGRWAGRAETKQWPLPWTPLRCIPLQLQASGQSRTPRRAQWWPVVTTGPTPQSARLGVTQEACRSIRRSGWTVVRVRPARETGPGCLARHNDEESSFYGKRSTLPTPASARQRGTAHISRQWGRCPDAREWESIQSYCRPVASGEAPVLVPDLQAPRKTRGAGAGQYAPPFLKRPSA
jgi:hypothetical protein